MVGGRKGEAVRWQTPKGESEVIPLLDGQCPAYAVCWPCARVRAGAVRFGVRVRGPGVAALLLHGGATRAGVGMLPSLSLPLSLS